MFSIFKQNKDKNEIPEWASFFDGNEYSTFLNAIDNYFTKKNVSYELSNGMAIVSVNNFGFNNLGLTNVAQVCKQDKPRNYKEIVTRHFDSMIRANQFDQEFKKIVHDFDKIKGYVGVRLYSNDYIENIGKELTIGNDFAGNIYSMLVFDLPDSVINIQPEQAEKWGKTIDELFEIGIQNIKQKYPLDISLQKFGEFDIWFVQSEHFFAPNIVFDLENRKELIGSKGSLIGIPHRHAVIVYPIENLEVVKAINGLIPTIYGMNEEGPGSVSNNLFWFNDGLFENLPYKIEENKLKFFPPDRFIELLNSLK